MEVAISKGSRLIVKKGQRIESESMVISWRGVAKGKLMLHKFVLDTYFLSWNTIWKLVEEYLPYLDHFQPKKQKKSESGKLPETAA